MRRLVVTCLLAGFAVSLPAAEAFAPTDAELASLPPYCIRKLKGTMTPQEGANYPHVHHYCFGLNFVNRAARSSNPSTRRFNLQSSRSEFKYVIDRMPKSHWMYPQIQTDMGHTLIKMDEAGAAFNAFNEALSSNPAYERAYAGMIELLKRSGSSSSVLDVATAGLRHLPESRFLRRVYLESGGKEPWPEPIVRPGPKAAAKEIKQAQEDSDESKQESVGLDVSRENTEQEKGTTDDPRMTGCRFCPPDEIQQRWRESFGSGSMK